MLSTRIVFAVSLAFAITVHGLSYSDFDDLEPWNITDPKVMCQDASFGTPEEALRIWYSVGAGDQLDGWIRNHGYDNWFNSMTQYVQGAAGDMVCSSVTGGQCEIGADDCYELVKQGKGQFYWILKAVSIFHATTVNIYTRYVQDNAISSGLHADQIIKDFTITGAPKASQNTLSQLSAALTIGGAIGTIADVAIHSVPLSAIFSLVGGIVLQGAQFTMPTAPQPEDYSLNDQLGDYFDGLKKSTQELLWNVLGVGDDTRPADEDALPPSQLTEHEFCDSPVCQFFADGKTLRMDPAFNMDPAIQNGIKLYQQALAFDVLGKQDFWIQVYFNNTWPTEEECDEYKNGKKGTTGDPNVRWIPGLAKCVTFAIPDMPHDSYEEEYCMHYTPMGGMAGSPVDECGTRTVPWPKNANETLAAQLTEDYEVKLEVAYESAVDCAMNSDTGEVDTAAIPLGEPVRCLFRSDVRFGFLEGTGGGHWWRNWNMTDGEMIDP